MSAMRFGGTVVGLGRGRLAGSRSAAGPRRAVRAPAARGERSRISEKRGSGCSPARRGSGCRGPRGPQAATPRHRDGHEARWRRSRARAPGAASRVHMRGGPLGSRLPPEPLHIAHSTGRVVCAREPRQSRGARARGRETRGNPRNPRRSTRQATSGDRTRPR